MGMWGKPPAQLLAERSGTGRGTPSKVRTHTWGRRSPNQERAGDRGGQRHWRDSVTERAGDKERSRERGDQREAREGLWGDRGHQASNGPFSGVQILREKKSLSTQ